MGEADVYEAVEQQAEYEPSYSVFKDAAAPGPALLLATPALDEAGYVAPPPEGEAPYAEA